MYLSCSRAAELLRLYGSKMGEMDKKGTKKILIIDIELTNIATSPILDIIQIKFTLHYLHPNKVKFTPFLITYTEL